MADKETTIAKIDFETVTIANGGTESANVNLRGMTLCGMYLPGAFTGTAISFLVSDENGGTYIAVADGAGSDISKTVEASKYIKLDPSDFAGIQFLKIVSNASESGDREIKLALRQV